MVAKLQIKRALLSVSDKAGLVDFAKGLSDRSIEIIATGKTARLLQNNAITVTQVADYTGFPEIMGGRVKTLHPKIHGGLLGNRQTDSDVMQTHDIPAIDLLVVNLYPFAKTIARPNCVYDEAIEQIDIGGPAMLRAAAKNHQAVTVLTDPNDYESVLFEIKQHGNTTSKMRQALSKKSFAHTASYDLTISNYLSNIHDDRSITEFPSTFNIQCKKKFDLRYGENPHQKSTLYDLEFPSQEDRGGVANAQVLQGKPLSFNNIIDGETALSCVRSFEAEQAACVIVKHATPCGVAQADTLEQAYQLAYRTDPSSCFGGIIAFNQVLDGDTAQTVLNQQFVEVILAPGFTPDAIKVLATKPKLRALSYIGSAENTQHLQLHSINGALLIQQAGHIEINPSDLKIVTKRKPSSAELDDLLFAWKVVSYVKSNAIVYAKHQATLGIGAGQTSRVFSAKIAILKAEEAGLELKTSVMASDAFFPFPDSIDIAAQAGIHAIIQPGGSKNDSKVIDAANAADMAMVFTGIRHFRH